MFVHIFFYSDVSRRVRRRRWVILFTQRRVTVLKPRRAAAGLKILFENKKQNTFCPLKVFWKHLSKKISAAELKLHIFPPPS